MGRHAAAVVGVLVLTLMLARVVSAGSAPPATAAAPSVSIIGDSVMTGVSWHPDAVSELEQGLAVRFDVAVCRALTGVSCPFEGERPPTLVDVVRADGSTLGPTVVVECGYNDPPATFARAVENSIRALVDAGVVHILWVNLREVRPQFVAMNSVLAAAAARHPELTILDWNAASTSKYPWFQSDGIHLDAGGGLALAEFLHAAIWRTVARPLSFTTRLPQAEVAHPYEARLAVTGGRPPYRWQAIGPLPPGLHLRPDGHIDGRPCRRGSAIVTFQVTDAYGLTATERQAIRVRPARA